LIRGSGLNAPIKRRRSAIRSCATPNGRQILRPASGRSASIVSETRLRSPGSCIGSCHPGLGRLTRGSGLDAPVKRRRFAISSCATRSGRPTPRRASGASASIVSDGNEVLIDRHSSCRPTVLGLPPGAPSPVWKPRLTRGSSPDAPVILGFQTKHCAPNGNPRTSAVRLTLKFR
jgi:hypothetical protein